MARLLGTILVVVPVGIVVALFWYWLSKRHRRDLMKEKFTAPYEPYKRKGE